jgi:GNAT superfamily N-acetyltransferase/catechol 2,3-dioxygenase-like lactoylglutathione lyase family enzyme
VAGVDEVTFSVVDVASERAQWAMGQYFDELDRRFANGFNSEAAFVDAGVCFRPPTGVFVVALDGDAVIGCGGIHYIDGSTAEIKRMWVDPARRGIGLGRRLLGRLEGEVHSSGRSRVVLDTNNSLTEAISMYGRLGYLPIDQYNDNPYADRWFEKSLASTPSITGKVEVNLSVVDPVRSADWYCELLGMERRYEYGSPETAMTYICLVEPKSQLVLCLVGHTANTGEPFSELRAGLDHLEFVVERREDLDGWARRLDELRIAHSGVKEPSYTSNAMLTFRDPDNIQLEFFYRTQEKVEHL